MCGTDGCCGFARPVAAVVKAVFLGEHATDFLAQFSAQSACIGVGLAIRQQIGKALGRLARGSESFNIAKEAKDVLPGIGRAQCALDDFEMGGREVVALAPLGARAVGAGSLGGLA